MEFVSVTLPVAPSVETIDRALDTLKVSARASVVLMPLCSRAFVSPDILRSWRDLSLAQDRMLRVVLIDELDSAVIFMMVQRIIERNLTNQVRVRHCRCKRLLVLLDAIANSNRFC